MIVTAEIATLVAGQLGGDRGRACSDAEPAARAGDRSGTGPFRPRTAKRSGRSRRSRATPTTPTTLVAGSGLSEQRRSRRQRPPPAPQPTAPSFAPIRDLRAAEATGPVTERAAPLTAEVPSNACSWAFACTQTESGALVVIDAGFRHALFTSSPTKTTAEQAVCRWTGVKFADIPPAL